MNLSILLALTGFLFLKTGEKFATQEVAGPTVALLTQYASDKAGTPLEAHIFNDPAKAIEYCDAGKPAVGIVTPGFYLTYAKFLDMEPLLEAKRLKVDAERYVLVVKKAAPNSPDAYADKTIATPLAAEPRFVIAVVLKNQLGEEFHFKYAPDVESAVFDMVESARSAPDAVLMEAGTWKALSADPELGPQIKAIFTSDDLPRNLLVLFRNNTGSVDVEKLKAVLQGMAGDPKGREILNSIQVDSFSTIDRGRLDKARELFNGK